MAENSTQAKRHAVFSIRQTKTGAIWTRIGTAFINKDGSLNVVLESLPVDGRIHIREVKQAAKPREDADGAKNAA